MQAKVSGVRVTMNNARKGANGVFLAKHLDSPEGKAGRMHGILAKWSISADREKPFEEVEAEFYETHFRTGLDSQNERHKKKGNKNRVRTMDEYRTHEDNCPESTLYYLGDRDNHADPRILLQAVTEFLNWREKRFPQVVNLDFALHVEDGAPHIHDRHIYIAHDDDGNEVAEQGRALSEMGILPPDPAKARKAEEYRAKARETSDKAEKKALISKAKGIERHNNAKMTYTRECREKLFEIARSYGIEIITEPREAGKQGRTQAKFITDDLQEKAEQAKRDLKAQNEALALGEKALFSQRQDRDKLQRERDELKAEIGDSLEFKALRAKREVQRAAERAAEEKAMQEKQEAEKRAQETREREAREREEAKRAQEAAINAQKRAETARAVSDIPKAETPVKRAQRPSVIKPSVCKAYGDDGKLTPETRFLLERMGLKPVDDDEDEDKDREFGE